MAGNAGIIMQLLGAGIGDQSPQRNPKNRGEASIDPSTGTWIPGEEPYVSPNFGTKLFHSDVASQEGAYNNQMFNAWNQNLQNNTIQSRNAEIANKLYGKQSNQVDYTNPEERQAAGIVFPDSSAQALLGGNISQANMAQSLPGLAATERAASLKADLNLLPEREKTERMQLQSTQDVLPNETAARKARAASELETLPHTTQEAIAQADVGTNSARRLLAPNVMSSLNDIVNYQTGAEAGEQRVRKTIADTDVANSERLAGTRAANIGTQFAQANTEQAIAKKRESLIPLLASILGNQTATQAIMSRFAPQPESPVGIKINPDGTYNPGSVFPGWTLPQKAMSDIIQSQTSTPRATLPEGQPLPTLKPIYSTLTGERIVGGNGPDYTNGNVPNSNTKATPQSSNRVKAPNTDDVYELEKWFVKEAQKYKEKNEGKWGHQNDPIDALSQHVAERIGLTKDDPRLLLGSSNIRGHSPTGIVRGVLEGKKYDNFPELNTKELHSILQSLPIDEKRAIFEDSLNQAIK